MKQAVIGLGFANESGTEITSEGNRLGQPGIIQGWGVGVYRANEGALILRRSDVPLDGTAPGLLCCHGHGQDGKGWWIPTSVLNQGVQLLRAYLNDGFVVLSIDAGGPTEWSNDNSLACWLDGYDYLTTIGRPGKIACLGYSMGGLTQLNALKRHPDLFAHLVAFAPATSLARFHTNPTYTAEVNTAYGGDYATNAAGHDPNVDALAGDYTGLGVPCDLYSGTIDPTVPIGDVRSFVTYADDSDITLTELVGAGHTNPVAPVHFVKPDPIADRAFGLVMAS